MKIKRFVLASIPAIDAPPVLENFSLEEADVPEELADGQVFAKTLYLSVDPYLRYRMIEDRGGNYLGAWKINQVLDSYGIGEIEKSRNDQLKVGDIVLSPNWPWQTKCILDGSTLKKLDPGLVDGHLSHYLGVVGHNGVTSLLGIKEQGHVAPGGNQTMVVSGAAGACGSAAGQIGRILGCSRVVGICGSKEKCAVLTSELGFDEAINYKEPGLAYKLRASCPGGVDVYFDNVGGEISDLVINLMKKNSHLVFCGQISLFNTSLPFDVNPQTISILEDRNIERKLFLLTDHADKFDSATRQLCEWFKAGKLKGKETIVQGFENAAGAFLSMLKGANIGKQIVQVAAY
ncbi:prostaglandin reductase 2-like isoform X2 [Hyperolius riggenbachi]|uniref:prostaglandin reductase 2-like isoform X2 n=1 Tax=Hyperolius riggenbachi TaxID=752182 RepID=UPI0035A2CD2B